VRKNLLSVVAIILSITAIIVVLMPRKDINASSLTLKDRSGKVWAVIDANHNLFAIYNPNTGRNESNWNENMLFEIETVEDGMNLILHGKDGFERIRLSTWTSGSEGSYITILRDGWQNSKDAPLDVVHISKDGVKLNK